MRIADQLTRDDLVDLHDLLLDGRLRAGVTSAFVVEPGPSVVVDAAHGAPEGRWTWMCAFRIGRTPVAIVFGCEYEHRGHSIEHELLRTAGKIQRRLSLAFDPGFPVRGAA